MVALMLSLIMFGFSAPDPLVGQVITDPEKENRSFLTVKKMMEERYNTIKFSDYIEPTNCKFDGNCCTNDASTLGIVDENDHKNAASNLYFYRYLVGVNFHEVDYESSYTNSSKVLECVLCSRYLSYNEYGLLHYPPQNGDCSQYNSPYWGCRYNICFSKSPTNAVDVFMFDKGNLNTAAGHRQWYIAPEGSLFVAGSWAYESISFPYVRLTTSHLHQQWNKPPKLDGIKFVAYPPPGPFPRNFYFNPNVNTDTELLHSFTPMVGKPFCSNAYGGWKNYNITLTYDGKTYKVNRTECKKYDRPTLSWLFDKYHNDRIAYGNKEYTMEIVTNSTTFRYTVKVFDPKSVTEPEPPAEDSKPPAEDSKPPVEDTETPSKPSTPSDDAQSPSEPIPPADEPQQPSGDTQSPSEPIPPADEPQQPSGDTQSPSKPLPPAEDSGASSEPSNPSEDTQSPPNHLPPAEDSGTSSEPSSPSEDTQSPSNPLPPSVDSEVSSEPYDPSNDTQSSDSASSFSKGYSVGAVVGISAAAIVAVGGIVLAVVSFAGKGFFSRSRVSEDPSVV